uniref:HAT C-terminal dimerisation domain-containing protein n=1 Tax=Oryza glaberrima TaxID=4538 RepID=I1P1W2_ORYGL
MERFYKRKVPEPNSANNACNSCLDDINWEDEIKYDPGLRKQIDEYHPNLRERVRRKYLENGPCQPRTFAFPMTGSRREKKDGGYEAFVKNGWNGFHRKERLKLHVGDVGGSHYQAMKNVRETGKRDYLTRLNGSIDVARMLVKLGLPFRGHDESKESYNRGNFREFRDYTAEQNPSLRKAIGTKKSDNSLLVAPEIQRDIVKCFAKEVLHAILEEIGHDVFCLLVDESRDVSCKEQMAVVLRYVDKYGIVRERFVGLVHVTETTSAYLKSSIDALFAELKLSLKLVLVAIVRKHKGVSDFFTKISILLNVVGGSSKRRDLIRDINVKEMSKALGCGQLQTGTGLNQEQCLQRPGDTRWSSHYKTLKSLVGMFATIVKVLEIVEKDKNDWKIRDQASNLLEYFQSFDFVFYLHLMLTILTITNSLSLALQRKDQDIVNAMKCVKSTRLNLDELRREKWEKVLDEVSDFCDKYDIVKLEMEDTYIDPKKRRHKSGITNKHYYQVDCFNDVIDWILQELDNRFSETSSQLLICSSAFSPRDSFHDFNLENLMSLAKSYPSDFNSGNLRDLSHQLGLYTADVRDDGRFSNIQTIAELSQIMVETRKHLCYPLVYQLLKLVLVLPVATATVERCFSAKNVKTYLRNKIGDEYLSDSLICYVEKEEMKKVTNEAVVRRFMNMQGRRFDDD